VGRLSPFPHEEFDPVQDAGEPEVERVALRTIPGR
jgi:hypothetical protein